MSAPILAALVCVSVVFIGAVVQATLGFGINMLSAPVVALVAPRAMPATVVLVALPLCVASMRAERHAIDWSMLRWLLVGALPGTLAGLWVVSVSDRRVLVGTVGATTLIGVALTAIRPRHKPVTASRSLAAGTVANLFGTISGSSGAPVAILFQDRTGPETRSTLGAFFTASATTSIVGYVATGTLSGYQLLYALLLLPAMLAGRASSGPVRARVDGGSLRIAVLVVAALSGLAALLRSVS